MNERLQIPASAAVGLGSSSEMDHRFTQVESRTVPRFANVDLAEIVSDLCHRDMLLRKTESKN